MIIMLLNGLKNGPRVTKTSLKSVLVTSVYVLSHLPSLERGKFWR